MLLLRHRSASSFTIAVLYAVANAGLYAYELVQFFGFGIAQACLPTSVTILSVLLVIAATSALALFGLDYLDYRKRRIVNN